MSEIPRAPSLGCAPSADAESEFPDSLEAELWASFDRVDAARRELWAAEAGRSTAISAWLQGLEGDAFWAALTLLYWDHLDVDTKVLGEATGITPSHISKHIGGRKSSIPCERCGEGIIASSRAKLKELHTKTHHVSHKYCEDCELQIREERRQENDAWYAASNRRATELQNMPYRDYLQTPEWQARRARMVKSAGYRCQLCNRSDTQLHVHHRTYERRGHEWNRDLVVLCKDCHEQFHLNLKVAK